MTNGARIIRGCILQPYKSNCVICRRTLFEEEAWRRVPEIHPTMVKLAKEMNYCIRIE